MWMESTGIGERLRSARQALGLSLEEVESATRIRRHYLEALELEAFDRIPGPAYVRGFLRIYGAHLGLAPDELLPLYPPPPSETIVPQDSPVEVRIASATASSRARRLLVGGTIVLVIGILAVAYIFYGELRQLASTSPPTLSPGTTPSAAVAPPRSVGGTAPAAPTPQAAPKPPIAVVPESPAGRVAVAPETPPKPPISGETPPAGPATTAPQVPPKPPAPAGGIAPATAAPYILAAPLQAEAVASARVWVRAVADGTTVFEGFMIAGDKQTWEATRELTLRVGNGGAVEVTVNGHPVGRLGDSGSVIDRTFAVGAPVSP